MYNCNHCTYSTSRIFDLRRHGKRKTPCKTTLTGSIKDNDPQQNGNRNEKYAFGAYL